MKYLTFKKDPRDPIASPNYLLKSLKLMRLRGCSSEEIEKHIRDSMNEPIDYKEKQFNVDTMKLEYVKSVTDVDEV